MASWTRCVYCGGIDIPVIEEIGVKVFGVCSLVNVRSAATVGFPHTLAYLSEGGICPLGYLGCSG